MPPLELSQAVLTQMSMRPKRCTTSSPSSRTEVGSVTSTVSASVCAPGVRLAMRSAVSLALSPGDVGHHGRRARLGEPQRRCLAHAAAAAGDDRDAAVQ